MKRNTRNKSRKASATLRTSQNEDKKQFTIPITENEIVDVLQDATHLKKYAKRLKEELACCLTQEDVAYDVKFSIMDEITPRPSDSDPPVLKVEAFSKSLIPERNTEKCIYRGLYVSWNSNKAGVIGTNSMRLPLLLCRGARNAMNVIHTALSKMFDTTISELHTTQEDLMWLVSILIIPVDDKANTKSSNEIKMEYVVPGLPLTDTITIKFNISDLVKVLSVIRDDESDEHESGILLNANHIDRLHRGLYTEMLELSGLQLGLCTLHRINLPSITIMGNRMKVMDTETMNRILLYLNEKALDRYYSLRPNNQV